LSATSCIKGEDQESWLASNINKGHNECNHWLLAGLSFWLTSYIILVVARLTVLVSERMEAMMQMKGES